MAALQDDLPPLSIKNDLWQLVLVCLGASTRRIYRYKRSIELAKVDWADLLVLLRENSVNYVSEDARRALPIVADIRSHIGLRYGAQVATECTGRPFQLCVDLSHSARNHSSITLRIQYIELKYSTSASESNVPPSQYDVAWTLDFRLCASAHASAISLQQFAFRLPHYLEDYWRAFSNPKIQAGFAEWRRGRQPERMKVQKFDLLGHSSTDCPYYLMKAITDIYTAATSPSTSLSLPPIASKTGQAPASKSTPAASSSSTTANATSSTANPFDMLQSSEM